MEALRSSCPELHPKSRQITSNRCKPLKLSQFNHNLLNLVRQKLLKKQSQSSKITWLPIWMCQSLTKSKLRMSSKVWWNVHPLQESLVKWRDNLERTRLIFSNLSLLLSQHQFVLRQKHFGELRRRQSQLCRRQSQFRQLNMYTASNKTLYLFKLCTVNKVPPLWWSVHKVTRLELQWWCQFSNKCRCHSSQCFSKYNRLLSSKTPNHKKIKVKKKSSRKSSQLSKLSDQLKIKLNHLKRRRSN